MDESAFGRTPVERMKHAGWLGMKLDEAGIDHVQWGKHLSAAHGIPSYCARHIAFVVADHQFDAAAAVLRATGLEDSHFERWGHRPAGAALHYAPPLPPLRLSWSAIEDVEPEIELHRQSETLPHLKSLKPEESGGDVVYFDDASLGFRHLYPTDVPPVFQNCANLRVPAAHAYVQALIQHWADDFSRLAPGESGERSDYWTDLQKPVHMFTHKGFHCLDVDRLPPRFRLVWLMTWEPLPIRAMPSCRQLYDQFKQSEREEQEKERRRVEEQSGST